MSKHIKKVIVPCTTCKCKTFVSNNVPVILVYCFKCRRWFLPINQQPASTTKRKYDVISVHLDGNDKYVKDLFHCDCISHLIVPAYTAECCRCSRHGDNEPGLAVFTLKRNRLNNVIKAALKDVQLGKPAYYNSTKFPKTVWKNRCGADTSLTKAYLRAFHNE